MVKRKQQLLFCVFCEKKTQKTEAKMLGLFLDWKKRPVGMFQCPAEGNWDWGPQIIQKSGIMASIVLQYHNYWTGPIF